MKRGKVYLVGAGPGDPGLITVKGLEKISQAEVIVYDRLIDNRLLEHARPDAEMIYVGKSAESHAKEQTEINRLLTEKAGEGKIVVRLKGGDPFVLGRGGEEAEELAANEIPFEIVPGVSAALAVPAYAGIPVTHRNVASSFAVITGHEDPTKEASSINWERLATGVDTLVFLMGMANLSLIVDKLIECGREPSTPVALIRRGTTLGQRAVTGTLATIAEQGAVAGLEAPVVIVVGDVVRLRDKIAWFEKRPLFGKRVLVPRARSQASVLSSMLAERGAEAIELPAIEIGEVSDSRMLDEAILNLREFEWLIFTSANGVEALWRRLRALGLDARHLCGVSVGAIGPATAEALNSQGIHLDFMPEVYTAAGIVSGLAARGIAGCRVLLPRSDIAPRDLVDGLVGLGAQVQEVAAYLTRPPSQTGSRGRGMLLNGEIDVITFTSSSTVRNLLGLVGDGWRPVMDTIIACIGPTTAATAQEAGLTVNVVASQHTIPGLVLAIERHLVEAGGGLA